jgi:hypothetical protein
MSSSIVGEMQLDETDAGGLVTLVSSESESFTVPFEQVILSPVIRNILTNEQCEESRTKTLHFPMINTQTLRKVVDFFAYKNACLQVHDDREIPDFPIDPQEAVDLLQAADFLDL